MEENIFYIYVYLDDRHPGQWNYNNIYTFDCQPFYVGKGKHHRMKGHLQPKSLCDNSIKSNTINAIIRETGKIPTHYKIEEKLSFEEANELETKLIKHFGRRDIGTGILTNMTDGGEGFKNVVFTKETREKMSKAKIGKISGTRNGKSKKVLQFDLEGNLIREWDYLTQITEETGMSFKTISNCCRGITKSSLGFIWKYNGSAYERQSIIPEAKDKRKIIYQYSSEGDFIKSYESVSSAKRQTGISSIDHALATMKLGGGTQWRYEFEGNKISPLKPLKTTVYQYTLDGHFIEKYSSAFEVLKNLKISRVLDVCRGLKESAGGYKWSFDPPAEIIS